jgi:hypothetical protein
MLCLRRVGLRLRGRNTGFGLRRGGAIIILNQLREHLPFVNMLEILDGQLAHVAGHIWPPISGRFQVFLHKSSRATAGILSPYFETLSRSTGMIGTTTNFPISSGCRRNGSGYKSGLVFASGSVVLQV